MAGFLEIYPPGGCANYDVFRLVVCGCPRDAAAECSAAVACHPAVTGVLDCSWVKHSDRFSGGGRVFRAASFICRGGFWSSITRRLVLEWPPRKGDLSAGDDDDGAVKL